MATIRHGLPVQCGEAACGALQAPHAASQGAARLGRGRVRRRLPGQPPQDPSAVQLEKI